MQTNKIFVFVAQTPDGWAWNLHWHGAVFQGYSGHEKASAARAEANEYLHLVTGSREMTRKLNEHLLNKRRHNEQCH